MRSLHIYKPFGEPLPPGPLQSDGLSRRLRPRLRRDAVPSARGAPGQRLRPGKSRRRGRSPPAAAPEELSAVLKEEKGQPRTVRAAGGRGPVDTGRAGSSGTCRRVRPGRGGGRRGGQRRWRAAETANHHPVRRTQQPIAARLGGAGLSREPAGKHPSAGGPPTALLLLPLARRRGPCAQRRRLQAASEEPAAGGRREEVSAAGEPVQPSAPGGAAPRPRRRGSSSRLPLAWCGGRRDPVIGDWESPSSFPPPPHPPPSWGSRSSHRRGVWGRTALAPAAARPGEEARGSGVAPGLGAARAVSPPASAALPLRWLLPLPPAAEPAGGRAGAAACCQRRKLPEFVRLPAAAAASRWGAGVLRRGGHQPLYSCPPTPGGGGWAGGRLGGWARGACGGRTGVAPLIHTHAGGGGGGGRNELGVRRGGRRRRVCATVACAVRVGPRRGWRPWGGVGCVYPR